MKSAAKVAKVAISLPAKVLGSLDVARRRLGRSRSAVVAQAIEAWLAAEQAPTAEDLRYAEGYRRQPESEAEVGAVASAAMAAWPAWE